MFLPTNFNSVRAFRNVHKKLECLSLTSEVCWQKRKWYYDGISHSLLDLVTPGNMTQIQMILSVLHYPRWPRQVRRVISCRDIDYVFDNKLQHCTWAFRNVHKKLECLSLASEVCCQKHRWYCRVISCSLLALAAFGDTTQVETILSVSHYPRWPRQVRRVISCHDINYAFANKLHQCTQIAGVFIPCKPF
jgi:hypothetical protein